MKAVARHLKRRFLGQSQAGQSIILMALTMIALLIFVGLVTDVGLLFVRFSQLRRAVDAASIAAAGQIRENRDYADVALSARQYIRLHGLDPDRVLVETCITNPGDPDLCVIPPRKLVRVIAQVDSPTTFLRLIGWGDITLEASAVAETAVIDVALVLDTSMSMSISTSVTQYTGPAPDGADLQMSEIRSECIDNYRWGGCCNDPGNGTVDDDGVIGNVTSGAADGDYSDLICQPFKQVRDAARTFIQRLDFVRGDRVVFVTFDDFGEVVDPVPPYDDEAPLMTDEALAIQTLNQEIGVHINDTGTQDGCTFNSHLDPDPAPWTYDWIIPCPDTNIGDGLLRANAILTDPTYVRREAVWVIILLSDGAANRTAIAQHGLNQVAYPEYGWMGYCPEATFTDMTIPFCSDENPFTRHFCYSDDNTAMPDLDGSNCNVTSYDATDFAMDMADFAGLQEVRAGVQGNFIAMYAIGFGTPTDPIPDLGEYTLRYVADAGDNGLIDNNYQQDCRNGNCADDCGGPCGSYPGLPYNPNVYDPVLFGPPDDCEFEEPGNQEDCGQYWYADNKADLERVFAEIASRLFTRLSR